MAGLAVLLTALVAALASSAGAATLHTREAVKPEAISCARATGPFPNPQDCGSFLQCEPSGKIVTVACPPGLEFNAWKRVCDYPARARCSSGGWVPPADDDQPPAEDDNPPEEEPATPPADAPECPAVENPEEAIQLPNPNDCNSFYKCDASGVAWLQACPAGLEYNAKLGVCDYVWNAGCSQPAPVEETTEEPAEDDAEEPTEEPAGDNAEEPAEPGEGGDDDDADAAEEPAPTTTEAPECPAVENPEEAIQLPNPNDCNSFYKCDASGVAWLQACPSGLEYNAKLGVCDYVWNAGCSQPAPVEEPAEEPAEDGAEEPAEPADGGDDDAGAAEEPAPTTTEAPECPAVENPEEAIQLPNPNDCNSFYKCDASGVAWLQACPAGLEYNAKLGVCDYVWNAGCSQPAPVEEPAEEPAEEEPAEEPAEDVPAEEPAEDVPAEEPAEDVPAEEPAEEAPEEVSK